MTEAYILTQVRQVIPYVDRVSRLADQHRSEFAFLPDTSYADAAMRGNLWVAVDRTSREFQAYLYFGGRVPRMRVFQICVQPGHRDSGLARRLISELVKHGIESGYLNITARVSSKLEANKFWQKTGFSIIEQVAGKTKGTVINVYSRDLDVPSLFDRRRIQRSNEKTTIQFNSMRPLLTTPSYVIDLNVFFDALRNRDEGQCNQILSSALKHQIGLFVTSEFVKELLRHSDDQRNDPILTFARNLPTLRPIELALLQPLIEDLKELVFPKSSGPRHWTVNDRSDLIHLAYSVHHSAFGFITRDSAVLRRSVQLHERYGLHVMSPNDFVDTIPEDDRMNHVPAPVIGKAQDLTVSVITDHNRATVRDFLLRHDAAERNLHSWFDQTTTRSRPDPVVVRSSDRIAGVGLWTAIPGPGRDAILHLYVDESDPDASRAIDHILECGPGIGPLRQPWRFNVRIPREQVLTRETALKRGFYSQRERGGRLSFELSRVVMNDVISQATWRRFRRDFLDITDLQLAETMPTYEEMTNTGIVLGRGKGIPPLLCRCSNSRRSSLRGVS